MTTAASASSVKASTECCPKGTTMKAASSGPERLAEVAADLKQALREAVPAARGRAGDARRLRMEHGAADADHRHRQQDQQIGTGESQQHEADQRESHAEPAGSQFSGRLSRLIPITG